MPKTKEDKRKRAGGEIKVSAEWSYVPEVSPSFRKLLSTLLSKRENRVKA